MQRETLIEKDEISDSRSVKNSAPTVENTNSKKKTSWDSTKAKTSAAFIALGAVYGDSGTSPVYAPKALMIGQDGTMDRQQVIGSLSPVFWPVMLVVTVKYVLTAMLADGNGEGGVFALFAAVRKHWKHSAIFAMIGGAAFMASPLL